MSKICNDKHHRLIFDKNVPNMTGCAKISKNYIMKRKMSYFSKYANDLYELSYDKRFKVYYLDMELKTKEFVLLETDDINDIKDYFFLTYFNLWVTEKDYDYFTRFQLKEIFFKNCEDWIKEKLGQI